MLQLSLPFHTAQDLDSESIRRSLLILERRVCHLPPGADDEVQKISQYVSSIKSLTYATALEYADFLRTQIEMGRKIARVPMFDFNEEIKILKTTQEVTEIPDVSWDACLNIMVMPGHTLRRENPKDGTKIYDWSGNLTSGELFLTRNVASIMLTRRWKPHPDHFEDTCSPKEIEKLVARGKKSAKTYADMPYSIQSLD